MSKQSDLVSVSQGASGDPLFIDTVNDRIGIGTSSPLAKTNSVSAGAALGGTAQFAIGSGTNNFENTYFRIDDSGNSNFCIDQIVGGTSFNRLFIERTTGNVGIGTSSPTDTNGFTRALDLNGVNGAAYYARTNGSATNVTLFANFGSDGYVNNVGAGNLRFFNNGNVERMRIDAAGRVTMPYQPAMHGRLTNSTTFNGGDLYKPDAVNVNIGNHYSSATGLFTAPVGGLYQISGTFLVAGAGSTGASLSVFPYYNGVVATSYGSIYQASFSTENAVAGVYLVPLSANDTLGLALTSSGTIRLYGTENFMSIRFLG